MNEALSAWPNGVCKEPIRTSAKLGVSLSFDQSKGELISRRAGKVLTNVNISYTLGLLSGYSYTFKKKYC